MKYELLSAPAIIAYALLSALVSAIRHPGDGPGAVPTLLRFLGALSCLRFRDVPGPALSVPFLPQRSPDPEDPTEGALLAMGGAAERAYVAAGGIVGIPGGPLGEQPLKARRAWASACAAAMGEWRRLRALRDLDIEPPHDPMVPPLPPRSGTITTKPRPPGIEVIREGFDPVESLPETASQAERGIRADLSSNSPSGGGTILRSVALLVALGLAMLAVLPLGCGTPAPVRRNAARETWVAASKTHLAAWQDMLALDAEVQQALTQPPRSRPRALADLTTWRARRQRAVGLAQAAQDQAERAADELALRSPPERQEQTAREAAENARALAAEVRELRAFAAALLAAPVDVPRLDVTADGGVR